MVRETNLQRNPQVPGVQSSKRNGHVHGNEAAAIAKDLGLGSLVEAGAGTIDDLVYMMTQE